MKLEEEPGTNDNNAQQVEAPNRRQRPSLNSGFLPAGSVLYNVGLNKKMSYITAELHELIAFFEVEPKFEYPDDPWPYTDALFEAQMCGLSINFAIQPAYKDVRIQLKNEGNLIYEFNGMGIEDVRYYSEKSGERLECVISDLQKISIWMKPMVKISEEFTNNS